MIERIKIVLATLILLGSLPILAGCAAPPTRGGEELGEVRGGAGPPVYKNVPWSHPAWGP
jgi:hypothetical protein